MITQKETEILQLLAEGLSSKQIASRLTLSFHTIESHRRNLRSKFEAKNVAELITKAMRRVTL